MTCVVSFVQWVNILFVILESSLLEVVTILLCNLCEIEL